MLPCKVVRVWRVKKKVFFHIEIEIIYMKRKNTKQHRIKLEVFFLLEENTSIMSSSKNTVNKNFLFVKSVKA